MKKSIYCLSVIALLLATSCSTTKITSSWREPDKSLVLSNLNKILIVALFKDETNSRKAEDQMAGYLHGKGVVSYNYFKSKFDKTNEEAIQKKIKSDGFDGAITMRLVDMEQEKIRVPSNATAEPFYYNNFSGYYLQSYNYYSNPNYYITTKIYTVEVNVYSIKEDKIIWTGLTETTDPKGVTKMTEKIAKVVYKRMRKEGFVSSK
jgi:hypothetical protein